MQRNKQLKSTLTAILAIILPMNVIAGGKSITTAGIPKQFQGRWAEKSKDCNLEQYRGNWVRVTSTQIIYYEVSCSLKKTNCLRSI
jgi:hypothetical protein